MMEKYLFIWEGGIFPKYFMLFGQTLWQTLVPWEVLSKKEVLSEMDAVSPRCEFVGSNTNYARVF